MKRFTRRLLLGMLLYALLFAAALAVFLNRFDGYLADYEASRPEHVAREAFAALPDEEIDGWTAETVAALNPDLMPAEESRALLRGAVRGAQLVRESERSYLLVDGETRLGRLVLEEAGADPHGFTRYTVRGADFDFSSLCASARYTVPADWTVLCNGIPLSAEHVVDRSGRYELLREFYGDQDLSLPCLWTYDTGLYLLPPTVSFLDGDGHGADTLSEDRFADNCSEEDAQALTELTELFLRRYIAYASNDNSNIAGNYERLEKLMVKGSTLQKRMRYAVSELKWADGVGDTLQEIEYLHRMDLGDGLYLCDLCYTVETTGQKGPVVTENKLKLIALRGEDGRLLMTAMRSY